MIPGESFCVHYSVCQFMYILLNTSQDGQEVKLPELPSWIIVSLFYIHAYVYACESLAWIKPCKRIIKFQPKYQLSVLKKGLGLIVHLAGQ